MALDYTTTITIDLPRDKVVALFDDPGNLPKWQRGLQSFEPLSGQPGQVGAKSKLVFQMGKRRLDMIETITRRDLPDAFAILRRRMEAVWGVEGTRHYIKVLRFLEQATVEQLHTAIVQALSLGATMSDAVRVLLEQRREQAVPLFPLDGRPHLKGVSLPPPDLTAYHLLCEGGES